MIQKTRGPQFKSNVSGVNKVKKALISQTDVNNLNDFVKGLKTNGQNDKIVLNYSKGKASVAYTKGGKTTSATGVKGQLPTSTVLDNLYTKAHGLLHKK